MYLDNVGEKPSNTCESIYNTYYKEIFSMVMFITRDIEATKDITQDTFCIAFQKIHTLREHDKMSAWLKGIASNVTKRHNEKRQKEKRRHISINSASNNKFDEELIMVSAYPEPGEALIQGETVNEVRIALKSIEPKERHILLLRYQYELSTKDISKIMGITEGNARIKLHRAKNKIKCTLLSNIAIEQKEENVE